jgi:predicted O-linked N-acetylglucosamine transferase (SPINDLY family)
MLDSFSDWQQENLCRCSFNEFEAANMNLQTLFDQAVLFHQRGSLREAERLYLSVLEIEPRHSGARHRLGVIRYDQGRNDEALTMIRAALDIEPNHAEALSDYALVLTALGDFEKALESYGQALALRPQFTEALYNRGVVFDKLKRNREALSSYDQALAIRPDFAEALNNRGNVLLNLGCPDEALASFDRALALRPQYVEALNNYGNALMGLKRVEDALASFDRALAIKPDIPEVLNNRGNALRYLNRFGAAIDSFNRALAIKRDYAEALNNFGVTLHELKYYEKALVSYDQALAIQPDNAEALFNRGNALVALNRLDEALWSYDQALKIDPDSRNMLSGVANAALKLCDWRRTEDIAGRLEAQILEKKPVIQPFVLLGYMDNPGLQLQCAKNSICDAIPIPPPPLRERAWPRHEKIRIAYLSADFKTHATAYLMAELFERHDRSGFEVLGISYDSDDGSKMRDRLVKSFDQFFDVKSKSDSEVAKLLFELEVDIAIDLKGYTTDSRPCVLSYRPCPVQVNYLGYPGTMGASFIDYVIADPVVLPFDQQPFFSEKIIHLPDSYQVNDSTRRISELTPTRTEEGLPEEEFVFCCFNVSWKINAAMFDIWTRLLHAVPGSVLWLIEDNSGACRNLRREAAMRGIDPGRLVFAGRVELSRHLARHRLADLFLDTLPVNAHTTASDALWAGLPLLTCLGKSFAPRVASSLLQAIGLPELITDNLEAYEALALKLAGNPALLRSLRLKLEQNRLTHPLFDTDRFRRHIETAYMQILETAERGEAPKSFSVKPLGR